MPFKAKFKIEYLSPDKLTLLSHEDEVIINEDDQETEITLDSFRETIVMFGEETFKNGFNYEDGHYVYLVPANRVIGFNFKLIG